jgi:pimeloyl-ACP methyl ester carboxylesterase
MTPPLLSQDIRNAIPGARLALIEQAGHFVMLENPAAFNTTLADFINSLT